MTIKLTQFKLSHIYVKLDMYWPNWPIDPDEKFDSRNQAGWQEVIEWLKVDEK